MTAFLASLSPLLIVSSGLVVLVFVLVFAWASSSKRAGEHAAFIKALKKERDELAKREQVLSGRLPTDAELDAWMRGKKVPDSTGAGGGNG